MVTHVNIHGVDVNCNATLRACPRGGHAPDVLSELKSDEAPGEVIAVVEATLALHSSRLGSDREAAKYLDEHYSLNEYGEYTKMASNEPVETKELKTSFDDVDHQKEIDNYYSTRTLEARLEQSGRYKDRTPVWHLIKLAENASFTSEQIKEKEVEAAISEIQRANPKKWEDNLDDAGGNYIADTIREYAYRNPELRSDGAYLDSYSVDHDDFFEALYKVKVKGIADPQKNLERMKTIENMATELKKELDPLSFGSEEEYQTNLWSIDTEAMMAAEDYYWHPGRFPRTKLFPRLVQIFPDMANNYDPSATAWEKTLAESRCRPKRSLFRRR